MSNPAMLGEVRFPVVEQGTVSFVTAQAERMPMLDRSDRFCIGHVRSEAVDILTDARAMDEPTRRLEGVSVRFLPSAFTGRSHGLALALADKFARFGLQAPHQGIVATGVIEHGGRGRIAAVDGFAEKLAAIVEAARSGPILFAFPKANLETASEPVRRELERAAFSGGLTLRPASDLSDLSDLWSERVAQKPAWSKARIAAVLSVALLMSVGIGGVVYTRTTPVARCHDAVASLDESRTAEGLRTALDICRLAVARNPKDGRSQFLLGQVYATNGSRLLAETAWDRAAVLGDPDGLAASGRAIWLSDPSDVSTIERAITRLTQAADAGSAAAAEDLASIYMDGGAIEIDPTVAAQWLRRAKSLRRTKGDAKP